MAGFACGPELWFMCFLHLERLPSCFSLEQCLFHLVDFKLGELPEFSSQDNSGSWSPFFFKLPWLKNTPAQRLGWCLVPSPAVSPLFSPLFLRWQHCTCQDDCSSSNCLCGQLSIRCWYDKVRWCLWVGQKSCLANWKPSDWGCAEKSTWMHVRNVTQLQPAFANPFPWVFNT